MSEPGFPATAVGSIQQRFYLHLAGKGFRTRASLSSCVLFYIL